MRSQARSPFIFMAVLFGVWIIPVKSADQAPSNGWQLAQARPKASEVDRLKEELAQARVEIERLKEENARLRNETAQRAQLPVTAMTSSTHLLPVIDLPPLDLKEAIPAQTLINHYKADAGKADARYKNQSIRIQGEVERFEPPWAGLTHTVYLKGADKFSVIKCQVRFPGISDLTISADGKTLSGAPPFRKEAPLLRVGEVVVLEGTCAGLQNTALVFKKCRPVR